MQIFRKEVREGFSLSISLMLSTVLGILKSCGNRPSEVIIGWICVYVARWLMVWFASAAARLVLPCGSVLLLTIPGRSLTGASSPSDELVQPFLRPVNATKLHIKSPTNGIR